jgi:hypothetical protein
VPAAAVIPAPIAYIKVVAVKKLVVQLQILAQSVDRFGLHWLARSFTFKAIYHALYWVW